MGKKLRNFLKKKSKKQGQKKGKLTTGQIEVLFETGTGGSFVPSDPTTPGLAYPQAITPNRLDSQPGPSGQNEICRRKLPPIPKIKPCTVGDKKVTAFVAVQERTPTSTEDHKPVINRALKPHSNSATNPITTAWAFDSRLGGNISQVQSTPTLRHNVPDYKKVTNTKADKMARDLFMTASNMDDGRSWKQTTNKDGEGMMSSKDADGLGMGDTHHDVPNLQKRNSQLQNILSRCLTLFENNALTQAPAERELVQEIREVLAINNTNPFVPTRLQEAQTGPFSRSLPSQGCTTTNFIQSTIPEDLTSSFSDSDDESFVSSASSFTSLQGTDPIGPNPFNIPHMEPSKCSLGNARVQQTPSNSWMPDICSKLLTAVNQLNNLVSSLSASNFSIYNSTDAFPLQGNNPFAASALSNKLPSNQMPSPFNPFCAIDTSEIQTAPQHLRAMPGHSNKSVPSKAAFDEFLAKRFGHLSATALSSSPNSSLAPTPKDFDQLAPNIAVHNTRCL